MQQLATRTQLAMPLFRKCDVAVPCSPEISMPQRLPTPLPSQQLAQGERGSVTREFPKICVVTSKKNVSIFSFHFLLFISTKLFTRWPCKYTYRASFNKHFVSIVLIILK